MSKIELLIQKAHGGLTDVFVTNKGASPARPQGCQSRHVLYRAPAWHTPG